MRIFVANRHEPYIELFAATGFDFEVSPPVEDPGLAWRTAFRPVPANVKLLPKHPDDLSGYDLVLLLSWADLRFTKSARRRMFVELNILSECVSFGGADELRRLFARGEVGGLAGVELAFISGKKRDDWGPAAADYPIVPSGVDTDFWTPGDKRFTDHRVLRVANAFQQRRHMQGYDVSEAILDGLYPSRTIGIQFGAMPSDVPASVEALREAYRRAPVMLSCLDDQREDGYNLAVLEAMATGCPVVATPNSSRPDGCHCVETVQQAREAIDALWADEEYARAEGDRGRQWVIDSGFTMSRCAVGWREVFTKGTRPFGT